MQRLFSLLLCSITCFVGCTFTNNVPKVETRTYDTPLDSLYQRCSDLKGIGMFEMGMSWKSVVNSKALRISSWDKKPNWYNGHWGVSDFEMQTWLISKHPEIKQFCVEVRSDVLSKKYTLGDIEFWELDLAFLNDKLVAAYYEFKLDANKTEIKNHYIQKYGEGIGNYYSSVWNNGLSGDNYACDYTTKDIHQWKNERVTLKFTYDYRLLAYPKRENKRGLYWDNEYYIVYDEVGLAAFEEAWNKAKDEYKGEKSEEHANSLNSL